MDASRSWVACVGRTRITIGAVQLRSAGTNTATTDITCGTGIAIIAGRCVVGTDAARCGIACVICTGVTIGTVQWRSTHTDAAAANVVRGARVTIVAGRCVV